MSRMRFGIFMAPFHPAGENPTLALERDLDLIVHLDKLGYDEAWIGEHHSAGTRDHRLAGDLHRHRRRAHAAHQAGHRRDQRGVPQPVHGRRAGRAARPPTRGRFMLGLGPGSLPTDAIMLGLDPTETRPLLEEGST